MVPLLTLIARKDLMASGLGFAVMDAYKEFILKFLKMQLIGNNSNEFNIGELKEDESS